MHTTSVHFPASLLLEFACLALLYDSHFPQRHSTRQRRRRALPYTPVFSAMHHSLYSNLSIFLSSLCRVPLTFATLRFTSSPTPLSIADRTKYSSPFFRYFNRITTAQVKTFIGNIGKSKSQWQSFTFFLNRV